MWVFILHNPYLISEQWYFYSIIMIILGYFYNKWIFPWNWSLQYAFLFQVKREDMAPKVQYATLYLIFIGAAYLFSYTKIALFLMGLHYASEAIFHAGRLLSYSDKNEIARPLYRLHDILFVLARLGSISLGK